MTEVFVLQHIWCETLGTIATSLETFGIAAHYIRSFEGEPIPADLEDAAGLIIMGGPMGVYDHPRVPFINDEMRLIEAALKQEKPVLGICLGSQLLATVLGADLKKGAKKEIGWRQISLTEFAAADALWKGISSPFTAYHWHGDVFDLPDGAEALASSELTKFQAFRYGWNAYGFLFHMEVTEEIIRNMITNFSDELVEDNIDGKSIMELSSRYLPGLNRIGRQVFNSWTAMIEK